MERYKKTGSGEIQPDRETFLKSRIEVFHDQENLTKSVMVAEGEKSADLYEFLPKETIFVVGEGIDFGFWESNPHAKNKSATVAFPTEEIDSVSGRLGILHEMGHAETASRPDYRGRWYADARRKMQIALKHIFAAEKYKKLKTKKEGRNYMIREFYKSIASLGMSREQVKRCTQEMATDERNAWAEALKIDRRIKKEKNINFLGDTRVEEIFGEIDKQLSLYQDVYGVLLPERTARLFVNKKRNQETSE